MHYSYKVYNLLIESDFFAYLEIWRRGDLRRPHDHPEYMKLMKTGNQEPYAFVYFEGVAPKIIYPFYIINIGDINAFDCVLPYRHMISAYGYGGPTRLSSDDVDLQKFESLLDKYISCNNIISEFVREDLFEDYKVPRRFLHEMQQENVVVDLTRSPEVLWKEYKHAVRKNVNRAVSSGLEIVFDFNGSTVDDFVHVYHMTMRRTGAKEAFLISSDMFQRFNKYLEDRIGFYVHVMLDGKVIATELVLASSQYLYSFLGGANIEFSNLRPSDYLKHQVNIWAIENGYRGYVLGGGVKPYDGIYNFKLSFDLNGSHPFHIQKNIHNRTAYNETIDSRRRFETIAGRDWEPEGGFFPEFLQGIAV